jgi:hypothetical protein
LLRRLPYDEARAHGGGQGSPNARRYRDGKQVYQTAGLLYEGDDGRLRITELGAATRRWLEIINDKNHVILARHAAYALAACQLRNPTGAGERYDESMTVFPFSFIWKAMLTLGGRISSIELNRALFKVRNEEELDSAIEHIARWREKGDVSFLGDEVVTGHSNNDRIIPWMSLASFGWILFPDKRESEAGSVYEIPEETAPLLKEASRVRHRHRDFPSVQEYVEHISNCASLPRDLR